MRALMESRKGYMLLRRPGLYAGVSEIRQTPLSVAA